MRSQAGVLSGLPGRGRPLPRRFLLETAGPTDEAEDGMERTPQECFEKLLNAYSHNYDLTKDVETEEGGHFPAMAHYFLRDEHYLVRRDKQFYATEQHDYTYFHVAEHLDAVGAKALTERTLKAGLAAIHPHKEHMSSFVTLVVLAETIDPEAKKVLKKTRFHKN